MAVLRASKIDGNILIIPTAPLERSLYEAVNKAIVNAGGNWKRGKGHVFPSDPRSRLGLMLETGVSVDEKKKFQAFYTPAGLAAQVVELACIEEGDRVLEPSAGHGALASEVVRNTRGTLLCVEINPESCVGLRNNGYNVQEADFMKCNGDLGKFDRVVMNPPFTKNQDVKHVKHALTLLKPGGILVAIMSANTDRASFQAIIEERDHEILPVEAGAFSESGTEVRTIILKVRA